MSIPGLGQIPQQPETASTRIVALRPGWEWRFHAPTASPLVIKIVSGTAEKDGIELAPRNAYTFRAARSRILTWQGCEIEVDGRTDHDSLPLVYYYGASEPEKEPDFYRELASNLAGSVSARLSEDEDVKRSGVIVDTMGVDGESEIGVDLLSHIIEEFSINVVVVIGTPLLEQELAKRFTSVKTSLGEPIDIVLLDKSDGVAHRDQNFMQHVREACIKEYFFGDARRTLSPQIQQADFDSLVIYRASEIVLNGFAREEASVEMQHWTFAIMSAGTRDLPDTVRASSVMGFVYVSDVDEERKKIKLLAPVSGRLGDKPLVWGSWPEPFINLLG
ncbi:unnamed protein product [Clonostachys rosea f. rosea IK726]|uniref:Polynucleotide 5'-hydroxyl-kinase GRC3 n=2 Tax=Bionectria ochroleuca TaxID=29856 RepID=A0A0B7K6Z1_BIOOC|nr:unnamed protein product [Clonostachys rosea f. rosea IK726]